MQQLATRPWITASVALAGAGVIAATPVTVPLPEIHVVDIQLTAGEEEITLDLVRHGQSTDNVAGIIGTVAPGAPLTAEGQEEADAVAQVINQEFPDEIAGIYASGLIRTQETAAPLAQLLGMNVTDLSGLNELNAGILEGIHQNDITGLLYLAAPLAWMFGDYWVPELGSSDYNGMAFESRFSDAVDTIYSNTVADGDGKTVDVAFSHAAALVTWTMMNVKNPDFEVFFKELTAGLIPNTGQMVLQGDPTDGWTLV
ncbi:MAG: histidine phosphatase family protein, partial [Mycobacterium sp.]